MLYCVQLLYSVYPFSEILFSIVFLSTFYFSHNYCHDVLHVLSILETVYIILYCLCLLLKEVLTVHRLAYVNFVIDLVGTSIDCLYTYVHFLPHVL